MSPRMSAIGMTSGLIVLGLSLATHDQLGLSAETSCEARARNLKVLNLSVSHPTIWPNGWPNTSCTLRCNGVRQGHCAFRL
jgi:hypothetical protein